MLLAGGIGERDVAYRHFVTPRRRFVLADTPRHLKLVDFVTRLRVHDLTMISVCALQGENIVHRSEQMPWYDGPTLLRHRENVHIASDRNLIDARFPVQYVLRPRRVDFHDYRGYADQIASGVLYHGNEVMVLPSGLTTRLVAVDTADGPVPAAFAPTSVALRLHDDLDVSARGRAATRPGVVNAPLLPIDRTSRTGVQPALRVSR